LAFATSAVLTWVGDGEADREADGRADWEALTQDGFSVAVDDAWSDPERQPASTSVDAMARTTKRERCTRA
jgi:hypothetical protein